MNFLSDNAAPVAPAVLDASVLRDYFGRSPHQMTASALSITQALTSSPAGHCYGKAAALR